MHELNCLVVFAEQKIIKMYHKLVFHVNIMLSVVGCRGKKILTTSSLKVFQPQLFTPPPPEHKVLGIGELQETGMLLYLAWPGLRGPANCPACLHTLSRVDTEG